MSTIRGHWQRPALTAATLGALVLAFAGLVLPRDVADALQRAALTVVIATPLLRIVWLCVRWTNERDWRFLAAGLALVAVVGAGAVAAMGR
ncbi:MAG: hypothetical protein DYH08_00170 [Actinobacteria bacterium ATB1]|nr:hypothetical protein [Actinobacteria bacterium ATB1]